MIIFPQESKLVWDIMVTIMDVQFNCFINMVVVMREHKFKMMVACCAFYL